MIHTLKYAKILEAAGFSREQAEASIKILLDVMDTKFATKDDFNHLSSRIDQLDAKFDRLDAKISGETNRLDAKISGETNRLDSKIDQIKSEMLFKMGAMMAGSTTITIAVLSFTLK